MKPAKLIACAAALALACSTGAAFAGNGKGNNGNGKGNGGSSSGSSGSGSTTTTLASCSGSDISVAGASCLGFFSGNLNGNKASLTDVNASLSTWGVNLTSAVASTSMLSDLTTTTIDFKQQLYGDTIISIHYGIVTDANGITSNNVTAFYRFDATGTGVDSFTTAYGSVSNATVYTTGIAPAVPEPQTYAMLAGGLALVGLVARRRKQA